MVCSVRKVDGKSGLKLYIRMSSILFKRPVLMRASKVMAHSTARTFVEPFLTYRSYIRVRIFIPLAVYLPLSLSYAMVSLPFKLPFDAKCVLSFSFFSLHCLSPALLLSSLSLTCLSLFSSPRSFISLPWLQKSNNFLILPFSLLVLTPQSIHVRIGSATPPASSRSPRSYTWGCARWASRSRR